MCLYKKLNLLIIKQQFEKEIKGYHLVNTRDIKEAIWEDINANILKRYYLVTDKSEDSHISGKDCKIDNFCVSNKTCKTTVKNIVNLSSYRLTGVCNNKNIGEIQTIIKEIERRDSSFDYYSILSRFVNKNNILTYRWFIVPKTYYIFNSNTEWKPKINKNGHQSGWYNKYMSITFSMSSQLWFHFNLSDIEQFMIHKVDIDKNISPILSYADLIKE